MARSGADDRYRVFQPKRQIADQVDESPTTENNDQVSPPGDYPDTPPGSSGGSSGGLDSDDSFDNAPVPSGPLPPPPDPDPDPNTRRF